MIVADNTIFCFITIFYLFRDPLLKGLRCSDADFFRATAFVSMGVGAGDIILIDSIAGDRVIGVAVSAFCICAHCF